MPIDINLRLGGAETWSMAKAVFDVDLFSQVLFRSSLDLSLGFELDKLELNFKNENTRYRCISNDAHSASREHLKSVRVNLKK